MNADYSPRDIKVHKILKRQHQKPVLEMPYSDCLDILLMHFLLTNQIPKSKSGYIIGLNPCSEQLEIFEDGGIWQKVIEPSKPSKPSKRPSRKPKQQ